MLQIHLHILSLKREKRKLEDDFELVFKATTLLMFQTMLHVLHFLERI